MRIGFQFDNGEGGPNWPILVVVLLVVGAVVAIRLAEIIVLGE